MNGTKLKTVGKRRGAVAVSRFAIVEIKRDSDIKQERGVKIAEAKKVLCSKGRQFNDREVAELLDFLYLIGEIEYKNFINQNK